MSEKELNIAKGELVVVEYTNELTGHKYHKVELIESVTKSYIRTQGSKYSLKTYNGLGIISGGGSVTSKIVRNALKKTYE